MAYYQDLREYIASLESKGKLQRIKRQVKKESELAPLFWLQFRGLPEEEWKSFLFENVIDAKGQKHGNVLLGPYASSREIFAMGMNCQPNEINEKWCQACSHPINPETVKQGPVQEVIIKGEQLDKSGLERLAAINEVPGFSGVIRTTTQFVSKDPDTGIQNVGCYSGMFLGKKDIIWKVSAYHHGFIQWQKWQQKGKPMPVAFVVGAIPSIAITSCAPVAYGVDEFAVAGAIAGEPVKLVKCQTVDLKVPATAEIVIEGLVSNEYLGPVAAFGDYPGYVYETAGSLNPVVEVTSITHRKNPIFTTTTVGYPPSDAAMLAAIAREMGLYHHLKYECYIPGLQDVAVLLSGGASNYVVVQIKKTSPWQPWQVLNALAGYDPGLGKIAVVVDEDIDPRNEQMVNWALSYSMQPHRDVRIITHRAPRLDASAYPPGSSEAERRFPSPSGASAMLIDATRKWTYAPVGLPKREFMEQAIKTWEEEGLPRLKLKMPWHGYHLGRWTEDDEENASLTIRGEHFKIGEKMIRGRVKISQV